MADVIFGRGSLSQLGGLIPESASHVLLVRGKSSFAQSGAKAIVEGALAGRSIEVYVRRGRIPTASEAVQAAATLSPPDLIVAVGGGAVLDTAKLLSITLLRPVTSDELVRGAFDEAIPLVAIPTTAGSGSERTPFAVAYHEGVKYSVDSNALLPVVAIVDPAMTDRLPSDVTASSAMDALAHSIESVWATRSTSSSREAAVEAMEILWQALGDGVVDLNRVNRDKLSEGATLAGLAIASSRTTASHALSYHLTSAYGVPHGAAVGLTLGAMLEFNSMVDAEDCMDARGPDHVRGVIEEICRVLGFESPSDASIGITRLQMKLGLPTELRDVGVRDDLARLHLARSVNPERLSNNPRALDEQDLLNLLNGLR